MVQKSKSINNIGLWSIKKEITMNTNWALHTLVSSVCSKCPRRGVLSVQNMQWNTHCCTIFLHPQHKPRTKICISNIFYLQYLTYFIQSSKLNAKSVTVKSHFTHRLHHLSKDIQRKSVRCFSLWLKSTWGQRGSREHQYRNVFFWN